MPFIFIGTGGMGKETISRIKYLAEAANIRNVFYLGFDIDSAISPDKTADIPLPNICVDRPYYDLKALEDNDNKEFFKWWPKGHTISTTLCGSSGAGQIRINGRFALFSRYDVIYRHIDNVIKSAKDISKKDPNDNITYVFLISSLGGGTGAGIFLDISFLIRHLLGDDQRFYGVFYDGTITKAYSPNTLGFAYAALGEIEYWLQNFKNFDMTYANNEHMAGKNISKLYDLVFLIQAETGDGKRFKTANKKFCPYIPMVAETLFTLMSTPDFKQFTISNSWNRFDNLHIKGMQIHYASFGMGAITYAQEEVRNYVVHDLIKKFILQKDPKSSMPAAAEPTHSGAPILSFTEDIEKPLMISERIDQSMTGRVLHTSSHFGPIADRLEGFKKKIGSLSKPSELQQLKSQYKIPSKTTDNIDEWGIFLSNYSADIRKILFDKRIQFTRKLEETVSRLMKESSIDMVMLAGWLDEALGVIEKNEEFIFKHKDYPARNITIENIGKTWASLLKDTKLLGGIKVEYKVKLSSAVDMWIRSELAALEIPVMIEFYAFLKDKISAWKTIISILQEHIQSIRRKIDISIGKYTSRDIAYNHDSLASNEFPLHIKLDINKDLVDTFILKERIFDQKDTLRQLTSLADVIFSGKGEHNGVEFYFNLISKEVFEGRERQVRGETSIEEGLYQLFFKIVEDKVSSVLNEIRIDDILEYWLKHQLYPTAKGLHSENNAKGLQDLRQRWAINFGDSAADLLISPQFFDDANKEEEWFRAALKSFIYNFKGKIRAFVRHGNQIKQDYWTKINLAEDSRIAFSDKLTIFVPEKFRYSHIIQEGGEENIVQTRSGHDKIRIFAETYAFPIHSLDIVKGYQEYQLRDEYLKHVGSISEAIQRSQIPSLLRHIDKRFYTEWRTDIGSDEMADVQGYWIYILGMGLGLIERDAKKKFVLTIGGNKKTLDSTLPGTLAKIARDYDLRDSLRKSCNDAVEARHYESGKDFGSIEEIFRFAYKKHRETKPARTPATKDAYQLWSEIETWIKPLEDGSFPAASRVPKTWDEMKKLLSNL